ncbi:MAG TPA: TRAP transporter large permease subunit [Polyangia bacterium]|jgi:tripartite ATP-independent transporter DctM subunit|nr:TRAP transporter large permease subunit [Polyangia bacterium]
MTVAVFLFSLLGAMALGMPIAFALVVCGACMMLFMGNFDSQIIAQNMINGADSFSLMAIPFFMLSGQLMEAGGISKRIVDFAASIVGHFRGGLGYVAVFAAIILASVSGSAIADTAALASLLLPLMKQYGYNPERSGGLIASAGIIAPMLPPSLAFIVFGVTANLSITKLFMAGVVPGLMMGIALVFTWWMVCRRENLPVRKRATMREVWVAFRRATWALLMPIIIVGGLKFGIFTPAETGAVVAFVALVVGMFVYRELKPSMLYGIALRAAKSTAVIMFLVAAALVSSWLITVADVASDVVTLLQPLLGSKLLLMLAITVLVIAVGTAMDLVPTVLILTPILMPLILKAGIDPVYFGVVFIMNNAIGLITPPVGTVLNVVCGTGNLSMDDLMKGVWPFLVAETIVLFILVLFPDLVLIPMRFLL